jgi:hypothetical protein
MYARLHSRWARLHWLLTTGLAGALGLICGVSLALAIFFLLLRLPGLFSLPIALAPLMGLLLFGGPPVLGGMLGGSIGGTFQWLLGVRFHDTYLRAVCSYAIVGGIAALPLLPIIAPLLTNELKIVLIQLTIIGALCGIGRACSLSKRARNGQKAAD